MIGLLIFCITNQIKAQSGIVAAGQNSSGVSGSINYSIGQIDFMPFDSNTNAGLQQVYHVDPFPVTWLNFTAIKQGNEVLLKWQTANEVNSKSFEVQRSINGTEFISIGTVLAASNSNTVKEYSMVDKYPNKGINYYKIKQLDRDYRYTNSAIAVVFFEENVSISCYPNPTKFSIHVDIGRTSPKGYSYQFFDINGKLLLSGNISKRITSIPLMSFKPASYVLKIIDKTKTALSIIIVKD